MSKLTNCQIAAQIRGLEAGIAGAVQRGDVTGARRRMRRLETYRDELRQRREAGLNPGAEIQESHIRPVRAGGAA